MTETIIAFSALSTAGILVLGFGQGLVHATDADHLAAVGTIVSERKSIWRSAVLGGIWGIGHTVALLAVGSVVLFLDLQISERTEAVLEGFVGVMLVALGLNVFRKLWKGATAHLHTHEHGHSAHAHLHVHEKAEKKIPHSHHGLEFSPRALIIGTVHGLAGSAGLMLIVIPTIDTKLVGILYILIFGIGSIGGMMLMSFLVGLPFHLTALRFNQFNKALQATAGLISLVLGCAIVFEKVADSR